MGMRCSFARCICEERGRISSENVAATRGRSREARLSQQQLVMCQLFHPSSSPPVLDLPPSNRFPLAGPHPRRRLGAHKVRRLRSESVVFCWDSHFRRWRFGWGSLENGWWCVAWPKGNEVGEGTESQAAVVFESAVEGRMGSNIE